MSEIHKKLRAYLTSESVEMRKSNPLRYDRNTRAYTAAFTIGEGLNLK